MDKYDPFANFTPRANPEIQTAAKPRLASPVDLDALDTMDAESLRKLIRTVAGAAGWVELALMDKKIVAQAMRLELARIALSPLVPGSNLKADIQSKMVAIDKWLDREEGKPTGSSPQINMAMIDNLDVTIRLVGSDGTIKMIEG